MPKLLHFPWLRRLLNRGVNTDVLPELMPDGTAREAINVRPGSITGNAGGAEAVKGEVSVFPPPAGQGYVLIGSASCNNRLVEFWASEDFDFTTGANSPIVRIDGVVVAESRNIPYVYNRPLQIAVVDDFYGSSIADNQDPAPDQDGAVRGRGIVYPADHFSSPLFWDVNLLWNLATSGDQSYFGDSYGLELNSVNLLVIPEFPLHTRNVEVGQGLPCGQYQYALRYVTAQGDRTNIGPQTPLISVPLRQHPIAPWQQNQYPGAYTIGGQPGEQSPYGIELKFRVDNIFGLSRVEIIRTRYNEDIAEVGQVEVVGIVPIQPNQVSVETFLDPSDALAAPIPLSQDAADEIQITVNKPKTVEYSDRRLTYANFEAQKRAFTDIEFHTVNGRTVFPITQGVYTRLGDEPFWTEWNDGYSDPVNNTYLKSFVRGERYGLGVMFWDSAASKSYVTEVSGVSDQGYQFPNRLDIKQNESIVYSDSLVFGATVQTQNNGQLAPTFDAFDQGEERKNNSAIPEPGYEGYDFINVSLNGQAVDAFRPFGPTNPLLLTTAGNAINDQTRMSQSPVSRGATSFNLGGIAGSAPLEGRIWAPRHNALGACLGGIKNVPSNAKAISVMRTAPANRVIAQGIACYLPKRLPLQNSVGFVEKSLNQVSLIIPDFINQFVDSNKIEQFVLSPGSFKLQFVRPVGFYTEQYNTIDYLSYAGVKFDEGQVNSQLQLPESPFDPTLPQGFGNYVGYNAWRTFSPSAGAFGGSDGGNKLFSIDSVVQGSNENNYYTWTVNLSENVYEHISPGFAQNANNPSVKDWHEPWYIVNIVSEDSVVSNETIDRYINTGCHVKTETCIGVSDGGILQSYDLLTERRGDVYANSAFVQQAYSAGGIPPPSSGVAEYNRYVYIDDGQSTPRAWLCVTDNTYASLNATQILSDLSGIGFHTMPDGVDVYGLYEFEGLDSWTSSSMEDYTGTVVFGQWGVTPIATPAAGSRILVRYNYYEPIRFFGGDATIVPSLGALLNRTANFRRNEDDEIVLEGDQYFMPFSFMPYCGWVSSDGYNVAIDPLNSGTFSEIINGVRQWAVYFDCERRSAPKMLSGRPDILQGPFEWPRVGYIMKPTTFDSAGFTNAGPTGHPTNYYQYPVISVDGTEVSPHVDSYSSARVGGFLLQSDININYTQQPSVSGFGIPFDETNAFQEKNYFPTGLITSLEFNQLYQDVPNLRTFLSGNLKTVSEENGEIKTIASALAGGGRNMYAWTDNGVVRVLTNKNVLTGADGAAVATQSILNYWGEEMWLSRNIGVPDQMWQFFVKGYAPTGDGYADNFFWADRNSLYRMVGDNIIDIGREKFLAYMLPILRSYPRGYVPGTSGFYNRRYNEAWMSLNLPTRVPGVLEKNLVVFNPEINAWNGRYTYQFDGYTQVGNDVYGHRNLETFKLDEEWNISGAPRVASITVPMTGDQNLPFDTFKEFMRWRVVGSKPDKIQILDPDFVVMCEMPNPLIVPSNPLWVKEYDGWEGWADRTLFDYDNSRKLPQKRYFYLRLIWNTPTDKNATSLSGQLKAIK